MKRSNVSSTKGRFTSGSFLKVLMPKISKDSKKNHTGKKRSAPNLVGGARVSG